MNTIPFNGVLFPHSASDPLTQHEVYSLLEKANKHRAKILIRIQKAGKTAAAQKPQKAYLGSKRVRLSALIEAAGKLPFSQRRQISEYVHMAGKMALHKPCSEFVRLNLKEKFSGGLRHYCSFGVLHKAGQIIVSELLAAQFTPKPFQYGVKGMGMAKAIAEVKKLHASGLIHGATLDIKNYYDSYDHPTLLQALPLPKAVIENVVIGRNYNLKAGKFDGEPIPLHTLAPYMDLVHQHGIPQGSASSPMVGSFFMSKIAPDLPEGTALLNYEDDFLIMAKSVEKLQMAKNALTASIQAMSVGKFELLDKTGSSNPLEFEFLGHSFAELDGKLIISVSERNLNKLEIRMGEAFDKLATLKFEDPKNCKSLILDTLMQFAVYVVSWVQSFKEASNIEALELMLFDFFQMLADPYDCNAGSMLQLATKSPSADVDFYG